jgi:AcrR family transcriptional regulator
MSARDRTRVGLRSGRRAQLVEIALTLVPPVGLTGLDASAVAEAAGVSKALVFYYFPTHVDLQAAVVEAAADQLVARLAETASDPARSPHQRLVDGLGVAIETIEQDPLTYTALARGAGGHPRLLDVFEETRMRVVRVLAAGEDDDDPPLAAQLAIRGWIAQVEDVVLHWIVTDRVVAKARVVEYLAETATVAIERSVLLDDAVPLDEPLDDDAGEPPA